MKKVKLRLHDISIPEKTWKVFKNNAGEETMLILGVGVEYKLAKTRILSIICAVVLIAAFIACVVSLAKDFIFSDTAIVCLIVYVICAFLCTKKLRYESTASEIKRCLRPEYRNYLNKLFVPSAFVGVLDIIAFWIIFILTIPYQLIMFVVGLIAPKFVVSKNGVRVAVPKGFGLDGLEAVGDYYNNLSLFDELMGNTHAYETEIINEKGCRVTLHSSDNVHFYTDGGVEYINSGDNEHYIPKS